jgi:lipopolysaccharide transport system ATP-binding protein
MTVDVLRQNPLSTNNSATPNLQPVTDLAISVRNVSKMYPLYADPRDRLKQSLYYALPGFLRGQPRQFYREFWALRDISFEVKKGEALGIIGKNGSGKSTLLQIIAGTLAPTTGEVQVKGRVAALLELGSGFDFEFTGRENVYLNGSILGFGREEMDSLFDEITAFADIGEFMDQPVKLYSSGMFVRLAFAVQACVNPDVLIVDEALAVGDIFFQQKCHARIEKLLDKGTSVILVTHDMGAVQMYCQQALLLDKGQILFKGGSLKAIQMYYSLQQIERTAVVTQEPAEARQVEVSSNGPDGPDEAGSSFWPSEKDYFNISPTSSEHDDWVRCTAVALCDSVGNPCQVFHHGQQAHFYYEFEALRRLLVPYGAVVISNSKNLIVHGKTTYQHLVQSPSNVPEGARIRIRQSVTLNLVPDQYTFDVTLGMMSASTYQNLKFMSVSNIQKNVLRLKHITQVGTFSILPPNKNALELNHFGVCDLPGDCEISLLKVN